jgi:hypothetical protein
LKDFCGEIEKKYCMKYIYISIIYRLAGPDLTPEERDARTVFCMQLAARIRPRDLEEFFSSVGKVRGYYYIVSML